MAVLLYAVFGTGRTPELGRGESAEDGFVPVRNGFPDAGLENLRSGRSPENLRSGRSLENLRSGRLLENLRSGRSLENLRSGRSLENLRSGRSLENLRSGRSLENRRSPRSSEERSCPNLPRGDDGLLNPDAERLPGLPAGLPPGRLNAFPAGFP